VLRVNNSCIVFPKYLISMIDQLVVLTALTMRAVYVGLLGVIHRLLVVFIENPVRTSDHDRHRAIHFV
jgi:hypothetical protein